MKTSRFHFIVSLIVLAFVTGCSESELTGPDATDQEIVEMDAATDLETAGKFWHPHHLAVGEIRHIIAFDPGQSPEGIVLDQRGNIFVSNRHHNGVEWWKNEIVRIGKDGVPEPVADLGPSTPAGSGLLGLITDRLGNVFAAFSTYDPATNGVYRISRRGWTVERLPGSENIVRPNGLVFDMLGNLYVTDSDDGAVWRYRRGGVFELWIQHPLLEPVVIPGLPPDLPGANGITYRPFRGFYVANTTQGTIIHIPVRRHGMPGDPVVAVGGVPFPDGVVMDLKGNIYFVNPAAHTAGIPALWKADPRTGDFAPVTIGIDSFDGPTSLAFGRGRHSHKSVFVVNSNLFFDPVGAGPGIVQVGVK